MIPFGIMKIHNHADNQSVNNQAKKLSKFGTGLVNIESRLVLVGLVNFGKKMAAR